MYELVIVGGGPAGMTAAVYAARKKINALLLAKDIGGQANYTSSIENYMGYQYIEGLELMDKFEQQLKQFHIDRSDGEEITNITKIDNGFELKTISGGSFQSLAVIVATGKNPRRLNVPGERELIGRGVSYCSICDGPLFAGESVAIIGGGNSALEAMIDLLKIAERVYSITEGHFTGDAVLVDRIKDNPKLIVLRKDKVIEIIGETKVEGLLIQDSVTGKTDQLKVRGIFIEIGLTPNSNLVKGLVRLNQNQEIEVNCNCETNEPGLFAAGDVASTPEKQIIIAAGEGAKAALQAHRYLQRLT
jgi:NADH-dependent peroxiredoxin subunit F